MKSIIAVLLLLLMATVVMAQDTVTVPTGTGTLALAVAADTVGGASHFPANRVYKLHRGGTYIFNGAITTNNFPLRIVGEPAPASGSDPGPAFLQAAHPTAGSDNLINAYGDLVLKNVWVTSWDQGNSSQWQNISCNKPNSSITIDGCIFDYSLGVTMILQGGHFSKYSVTNSIFRNQINKTQWWCSRSNYFNSSSVDSVWMENNTFINQGFCHQEQDYGNPFFVFNHNTVVNIAKFVMLNEIWRTAYVANNVFYNCHFAGERLKQDAPGQDPDGYLYGAAMDIDTLSFKKGSDTLVTDPTQRAAIEAARTIGLAYNANYREPWFQTFYDTYNIDKHAVAGSDTALTAEPLVNTRTMNMTKWHSHIKIWNNYDSTSPGFFTVPNNKDSILAFLHAQFYATGVPVDWSWDGGGPGTGQAYQQYTFPWVPTQAGFYKFPENLAYSSSKLLTGAIGGVPVGDLNWFPTAKATWTSAGGRAHDLSVLSAALATAVLPTPDGVPNQYRLDVNYPNPFNPSTVIGFSLPQTGNVKLVVYNTLGQVVRTLVSGNLPAGAHRYEWDGKDQKGMSVGSGVYFYRLTAGSGFTDTKKMMLMK